MNNSPEQHLTQLPARRDEEITALLLKGLESYNLSVTVQQQELELRRAKDLQDFEVQMKEIESEERKFERYLAHDLLKFNRVFWLSALSVVGILLIAAGLIFLTKDVDKGVALITYAIIGILALLAGRGLGKTQPPAAGE